MAVQIRASQYVADAARQLRGVPELEMSLARRNI